MFLNIEVRKYEKPPTLMGVIKTGCPKRHLDNAPTLWEDILYKDGYRTIPETITVGTEFALSVYGSSEVDA